MKVIVLLLVAALAVAAGAVVNSVLVRAFDPEGREARVARIAREERAAQRETARRGFWRNAGEVAMNALPIARDKQLAISSLLKRAGWRMSPSTFWALTLACALAGVVVGLACGIAAFNVKPAGRVALAALGAFIGLLAPRFAVARAIRRRRQEIEASLPATLEQLAIVVDAGQTVERGIRTIAQRTEGPLAEEIAQVDADITYFGRTAPEALGLMAERLDVPSVSLFAASVSQSVAAGSPIAKVLKSQAKIATDAYYLAVEEQSNKIRTKMIFPTVLFILPPIFIISLGPTVLRLMEELPKITGM